MRAPDSITAVIDVASMSGPASRFADRHGAAEAHDPQRHHPAPDPVVEVLLEHGRQRRDDGEVGEARPAGRPGRPAAGCGAGAKTARNTAKATSPTRTTSRGFEAAAKHRADRQRAEHGADAEAGVEVGRTRCCGRSMPRFRSASVGSWPTNGRQTAARTEDRRRGSGRRRGRPGPPGSRPEAAEAPGSRSGPATAGRRTLRSDR